MPRSKPKSPKLKTVRTFLKELEWSSTKKYVEMLDSRGDLLRIGRVDVDAAEIVARRFLCDAQRCIHWAGDKPLVDRSCCCRYGVPVTKRDRQRVRKHLDQVRENLPPEHRLQDPEADPFEMDDDYGHDMVNDNPLGGCQFNLYIEKRCRCAIHKTALEHGEDPGDWKPLACSLWPMALNDYDDTDDGEERFLLTVYCEATDDLFDQTDEEPFACIVDQDPSYERLYKAERPALEYMFGKKWWRELDAAAKKYLKKKD